MSKVEIKLNSAGIRELLKSGEMRAICEEHANKAVSRLGEGYVASSMMMETRVFASVYAESAEAKAENMEHNTILKALGG